MYWQRLQQALDRDKLKVETYPYTSWAVILLVSLVCLVVVVAWHLYIFGKFSRADQAEPIGTPQGRLTTVDRKKLDEAVAQLQAQETQLKALFAKPVSLPDPSS